MSSPGVPSTADVRDYWNRHIHDLEITTHPVGSPGFFADLDQYHFEKLHHLLGSSISTAIAGARVLEVGCGAGTDLARFAQGRRGRHRRRPLVVGDRARARRTSRSRALQADLREADGEQLPFADNTSIWCTRTASSSTRPIRRRWSRSAGGC